VVLETSLVKPRASSFFACFALPRKLPAEPAGIEAECLIPVEFSKVDQQPVKFGGKQALCSFLLDRDIWAVPEGQGTLQSSDEAALVT